MTIDLRAKALEVVTAAANDQPIPTGNTIFRVQAARDVRAAADCGLHEAARAVDWAIKRVNATNLERHRVPSDLGWVYLFANGHEASVINDPHRPFRFEVLSDDPADAARGRVAPGLTSEQVEAKLHHIAALPAR